MNAPQTASDHPVAPDIPIARQLTIAACSHGYVIIQMLGEDGHVLSAASLTTTEALQLSAEVLHRVKDVLTIALAPAAGNA